ncbi:unnamed protein product [Malus baccata var. baccata]
MELAVRKISFSSLPKINVKPQEQRRPSSLVSSALPETVASIAIAAAVVGTAATILAKRTKASEEAEVPMKICEACWGLGYVLNAKVKALYSRNSQTKVLRGQDWLLRIWPLDTQQGFQRNGATAQSALLRYHALPAMAVER